MITTTDTIVAPATPPGKGGIAILRLSGPGAAEIGLRLFHPGRRSHPAKALPPRRLVLGWIVDDRDRVVDEVLAVHMPGPKTYTGQDVFEIQAHGGTVVLGRILDLCLAAGARLAEPGEFTWRAFLAGRIDLTQAEAVSEMIEAATKSGAELAAAHLSGGLTTPVEEAVGELLDVLAEVEAEVDFPEEDISPLLGRQLLETLQTKVIERLKSLLEQAGVGRTLREGARVALVGRPNAGKSSLMNALLGRYRALVTEIPGTTRDYLEESLDLDGLPVVLTDTAGLRLVAAEDQNRPELAGIQATHSVARAAGLVLAVVDATLENPLVIIEDLSPEMKIRTLVVANKIDLCGSAGAEKALKAAAALKPGLEGVAVSAKTGQGLDGLKAKIRQWFISGGLEPSELTYAPSLRQAGKLQKALEAAQWAARGLTEDQPLDLVAVDLREALDQLGDITGRTAPEEVLNRIFEKFCIGK